MPTHKMKLFSLLMGNSTPVPDTDIPAANSMMEDSPSDPKVPEPSPAVAVPPPSPHSTFNLDGLRRIFQVLSSLNQNKTTEAEVDEEPLQMRQKYLGIFERLQFKFGNKSSGDNNTISKRRINLNLPKEKFLALIHSRSSNNDVSDQSKPKSSWARDNINRLTSSMRHVKSDSFLARKMSRPKRKRSAVNNDDEQIRLPSMKTKKRSTRARSKAIITNASEVAHKDLVKDLQANSSQHCLDELDFRNYQYPFENLVFEGGGAKVHTYIGAIKCLEEAGIKPKRLAGTSAGAITAGLLAVGYTSEEIHILYEYDVEYNVKDGTCGLLSLLPNMFRHYGWNPGDRAMRWFGECLAVKTGNPDITFQQIYDQYGIELCIVAVNLSNRCEEYFHPKTSPDMPVKLAARMSSSLPGYFQPVKQGTNVYIDGGLLCNYPVHVFDGWWLSMAPDDVFYKRMGSMENLPGIMDGKNRFGGYNEKTLGFCMFSMFDDKALRFELEKRHKLKVTERPKTKLAMKRLKLTNERNKREETRDTMLDALSRFFRVLRKAHIASGDKGLKKDELVGEFNRQLNNHSSIETPDDKQTFTRVHCDIIFGPGVDLPALLQDINADDTGTVSNVDLIAFLSRHEVDIQGILGTHLGRREVSNFGSFFMTVQESLMNSARRVYIQTDDLNRTVGINTDYIKMDDFSLEREDQEFLIQQGYKATAAFLRYYIHQAYVKPLTKSQPSSLENSDLSAEESDFSPCHQYSGESTGDISDYDHDTLTSSSSRTSRSTRSPSKSIGSQATTQTDQLDIHCNGVELDDTLLQDHEEIIVAEVEITPESTVHLHDHQHNVDSVTDLQELKSLTVADHSTMTTPEATDNLKPSLLRTSQSEDIYSVSVDRCFSEEIEVLND